MHTGKEGLQQLANQTIPAINTPRSQNQGHAWYGVCSGRDEINLKLTDKRLSDDVVLHTDFLDRTRTPALKKKKKAPTGSLSPYGRFSNQLAS